VGHLLEVQNKGGRPLTVITEPLGNTYTLPPGSHLRITSADMDLDDIYVVWSEQHLVVETQGGGDFNGVNFEVVGPE
jgi:hypothetical protein